MAKQKKFGFGVIGLGRFGMALAKLLAEAGQEVIVLDRNEGHIKTIRDIVPESFLISDLSIETLENTGINECNTVIVAISEIETSVLTTQRALDLGVDRVISKASNTEHGMILEKLGADVVYPETETAARLVTVLLESKALDIIRLSGDYIVSEIMVTEKAHKLKVSDLHADRYGLKLSALEIGPDNTMIDFSDDQQLALGDAIVVIGRFGDVERFEMDVMN